MGIGGFIVYDLRRRPVLVLHIIYNPYNYFFSAAATFRNCKNAPPPRSDPEAPPATAKCIKMKIGGGRKI